MKRFIASLLSFIIISGLFNCYTVTAASSVLTKKQETLLRATGIIDDNADWDKTVTRGEFAQLVAAVAFGLNEDIKNYSGGNAVSDVKKGQKAYDAVSALYSRGYVTTDKFGLFYPDEMLSADAAYEMIMRTIGYRKDMPYPNESFTSLALRKGIAAGVTIGESGEITLYNAYILIYNMLNCDIKDLKLLKYDSLDNNPIYMSVRLGLYAIDGIVTDDGSISLYGDSKINEGYVCIDDGDEFINKTGREDLFGLDIFGYFSYNRIEDEYTLLAAFEKESSNRITEILSENIDSFNNRTYTYVTDEFTQSLKKIKVPQNAVILFNDRPLGLYDDFSEDMFIPGYGVVRLYDNDGDGTVNIVRIENYTTDIVQLVNNSNESIYVKNNRPSYSLWEKEYVIYDRNGKKMSLSEIKKDSVISVLESLDKEHYKIIVSAEAQTDTVVSCSRGSEGRVEYITTASGGKYEFNAYAAQHYTAPEMNTSYKFVFDIFDKVTGYSKDETNLNWQFGYLMWIKEDSESDLDEYIARIYSENGEFFTYTLNKKVSVIKADDSTEKYIPVSAAQEITYKGIVRYKINKAELLTDLEIPHTYGTTPKTTDRLYCIVDTVEHGSMDDYYVRIIRGTINYGGAAVITGKTTVFDIPQDESEYDRFTIGDSTSFVEGQRRSLIAYGTDYKSKNAQCVMFKSVDSTSTSITNEWPTIVSSVSLTYDERKDKAVYTIETPGSEFYMEPEVYENQVFSIANGERNPVLLQPGDTFYYKVDNDSYIKKAVLVYDMDREVTDERGNKIKGAIAGTTISYYSASNTLCSPFTCGNYTELNPGSATSWKFNSASVRVWSGWVRSYEDGYMVVTNQNPAYGYNYDATKDDGFCSEVIYYDNSFAKTVTINSRGKVRVDSTVEDDIKPYDVYGADCSRVVVTQRVYDLRSVCIINQD